MNSIYIDWLSHQIEVFRHRIDNHRTAVKYDISKPYHKRRLKIDLQIYTCLKETKAGTVQTHSAAYIDWLNEQLEKYMERENRHAAMVQMTRASTSYYRHRQTAVVAHEIVEGLRDTIAVYEKGGLDGGHFERDPARTQDTDGPAQ